MQLPTLEVPFRTRTVNDPPVPQRTQAEVERSAVERGHQRLSVLADLDERRNCATREFLFKVQELAAAYVSMTAANDLRERLVRGSTIPAPELAIPFPHDAEALGFVPVKANLREWAIHSGTLGKSVAIATTELEAELRKNHPHWPF